MTQMATDEKKDNCGEVEFLYKELTYAVIGAAIEVHRVLGPGFLEKVYENALTHELALRKINYRQQAELQVMYKGTVVGLYIADLVIEDKLIVELKAEKMLTKIDEAQ